MVGLMHVQQRIRSALTRRTLAPDESVVEELSHHARAMYEAARADGCSIEEAERRIDLQIVLWASEADMLTHSSRAATEAVTPPETAGSLTTGLLHDLRYAIRLLRRHAAFTLLAVATMALGIGATTTIFSVAYAVLLKPLPWPNASRVVLLEETRGGNRPRFSSFSNAAYHAWRERATTVETLAAWAPRVATLTGAGDPERIRLAAATASLFPALGVDPLIGTFFDEDDERATEGEVVVLSESLWRQRYGADANVLGRLVYLDGQAHRVVGVLPAEMAYPNRETRAWVPFRVPLPTENALSLFGALAKLGPALSPSQAAAEGTARGRFAVASGLTTMAIFGSDGPIEISARPIGDAITSGIRRPLLVLMAAVGLVLLTATVNVANLQLARAAARRREMAICAALGARAGRITRQLLIESAALGIAGGAAGLGCSVLLHGSLPSVLPADFPRLDAVGFESSVVAFAAALSLFTSVAVGLFPALRARRVSLVESLSVDQAATNGIGRTRAVTARSAIITAQVSIACVLLIGGSLLGRSFVAMLSADRGYDPSGLLTARLSLPASSYSPGRRYAIVRSVLDRLATVPGVVDVAFTSELPLSAGGSTAAFRLPSAADDAAARPLQASPRIVSSAAFDALRMRVVAGRGFADSDSETSHPVAVVNQSFARRYLRGQPVGARIPMGVGYQSGTVEATIVGVVDDVRYVISNDTSLPEIYYSFRQFGNTLPVPVVTLLLRTEGNPEALAGIVRVAAREADDRLVPEAVMTMEDRVLTSLARPRLYAVLVGGFAVCAVAMAGVGLFAVLSYTVGQRRRELAVRTALGARTLDIVFLVVSQGLTMAAAGVAIGVAFSLVATRWVAALLYGIAEHDPLTYVAVPVLLLLVAAAACIGPAFRAIRLDSWRLLKS